LCDCGWARAGVALGHRLATSLAPRHPRFADVPMALYVTGWPLQGPRAWD
jgi:hypothetical protein